MKEKKISGIILQPHNTPLSEINHQHKQILKEILQLNNSIFSCENEKENLIYPVYPSHCLVQSKLSINELKKKITQCSIYPPTYENGFLYRPVEIDGTELQPLPLEILQKILPILKDDKLKQTEVPSGFIFGHVKNELLDKINIKELNNIFRETHILNLRVFRLHEIEYTYTMGEIPSPLYWTMELPHWVKLK